jgi:two-component system, NarL family, response regulator NreC
MPRRTRILLVDDHTLVRKGFRLILSQENDLEVVGEASNGRDAVALAQRLTPDVVILDVAMPDMNGVAATRAILDVHPEGRVLMLSMHADAVYVRESLRAGARGYLLKEAIDHDLLTAVRALANGQSYLSPAVATTVLTDYRQRTQSPLDQLTAREREVLQMLAEGLTAKDIASKLDISVYTVDAHRSRIMKKLQLNSVGELVRFAMRAGLVQ